ncbi:hypothetical protein B0H19DRAFT_405090 [Mycena capillaripes]|nr:hypothetical protein B0H19DRAFT_405090 [Mycena capillaripes]
MTIHNPNSSIDLQLTTLRDSPVNNDGASDTVLASIFTYLMGVPPDASDGRLHWFCVLWLSSGEQSFVLASMDALSVCWDFKTRKPLPKIRILARFLRIF